MGYSAKLTHGHDGPSNVLGPTISRKVERELGQRLQAAFAEVLEEPVPQRFIDLLDELVRKSQQ